MRSLCVALFALIILGSPLAAADTAKEAEPSFLRMETTAGEDFTHLPLAEFLTLTTCPNCPDQEHYLDDIFATEGYPWYFVSLVADENSDANSRAGQHEPGVITTPSTYYDGGHEQVDNGDRSDHVAAIESSGERADTEVALELSMEPVTDDPNRAIITFTATWEEDGTITNPDLQAHIRVYVLERISTRYQNSRDEWVIHALLSFAYDEDVDLDPHTAFTETVEWVGADESDEHGDMSDVVYSNLMAIAGVFNDESSDTDQFSLEGAGAIPPDLSLIEPLDGADVAGNVDIGALAVANHSQIGGVQYRIDEGDWQDLEAGDGDEYLGSWDSREVENGERLLDVRAVDRTGTASLSRITVMVDNDENAPELAWMAPDPDEVQSGTITIEVEADDPQGIDAVELKVDEGSYRAMDHESGDTYTHLWDTTTVSNEVHTLTVRAVDGDGNEAVIAEELEVFNDASNSRPSIELLAPRPIDGPLHGIVELVVEVTDPGTAIDTVEYTFQGAPDYDELEAKAGAQDQWRVLWNTARAPSGPDIQLGLRATNDQGRSSQLNTTFKIDNAQPSLEVELPHASNDEVWATQGISITALDGQGPVTVQYRLDSDPWTSLSGLGSLYTAEWETTMSEDGFHTLHVQVLDQVGNSVAWSNEYRVINGELATLDLGAFTPPAADASAELTFTVDRDMEQVTLVITSPVNHRIPATPLGSGRYTVTFPAFEDHEGAQVVYYLLLETDHGEVRTGTETFTLQPAAGSPAGGGGDDDSEDDNTPILVGILAAALVAIGGGAFFWHSRRETDDDDEWDATPQPAASGQTRSTPPGSPPGMTPGMVAGMAPAPPAGAPVTCPHCQMQLMPPPGPRPIVIECPNCTGQMQIN